MKRIQVFFAVTVMAALLLTGCGLQTLDELYCPPKRSDEYNNLQSVIDQAMGAAEYSSPRSGENQQTVQMADLDGDGHAEYLLFAKDDSEQPMKIFIFKQVDDAYTLVDTIANHGTAFDQVEYVQLDGAPGYELVVGRQVSDQVLRTVSVYSFADNQSQQLLAVNYTEFLTLDIDGDALIELLVLRPGASDMDRGVAELYGFYSGTIECLGQADMSEPADHMKRIMASNLQGGLPAVYVASAVGEDAIITDIYAVVDGTFKNVSFSNESGTSVKTLRNYYVYATDIDSDGVLELPDLITMPSLSQQRSTSSQYLIRWYSMTHTGEEVDKMFTYHNYIGGWYIQLDGAWASRISTVQNSSGYDFFMWDESLASSEKVLTLSVLTGSDRDALAVEGNRFVLYRSDTVVYAAELTEAAAQYGLTQEKLTNSFRLIHLDWKTGET